MSKMKLEFPSDRELLEHALNLPEEELRMTCFQLAGQKKRLLRLLAAHESEESMTLILWLVGAAGE